MHSRHSSTCIAIATMLVVQNGFGNGAIASVFPTYAAELWISAVRLLVGSLTFWSTYFALLLGADVLYYRFAVGVVCPNATLKHGYNMTLLLDNNGSAGGNGLDYGFNYYNGDYSKSRREAQLDKYEHAWSKLKLKPGNAGEAYRGGVRR